jgi:competence protein ComEC
VTPLPALCLALVAGLVIAPFVPAASAVACGAAIAAATLQVVASLGSRRHLWPALAAVGAALALGWARGAAATWPTPAFKDCEHVLVGDVSGTVAGDDGRWYVALRLHGAAAVSKDGASPRLRPVSTEATLAMDEGMARRFRAHDRVLARARSLVRRQRRNFGDGQGLVEPRAFGSLVAGPLVVGDGPALARGLDRARAFLSGRLAQVLSRRTLGIVVAMVLGDRSLLDDADVEAFRRTGTAHLLAVSGLNVTLVSLFILWLSEALLRRTTLAARFRVGVQAALIAASGCWGYALLTGLAPPVFRAAVMTSAALAARAIGRPPHAGRAIGIAAAILLFHDPSLAYSAGFQLSFAAVLALDGIGAWAGAAGAARLGRVRAAIAAIWRTIATSLAASLATSPILAYHFGLVSPLGVAVNVVAVPVCSWLLLPAMFLLAAVSAVSPWAARGLGWAIEPLIDLFLVGLRWSSGLDGVCAAVSRPALHEALLLSVAGVTILKRSRRARVWALALAVAAAASWAVRIDVANLDRSLTVTFVDVGAGDAVLIDLPEGKRMLVDAGPRSGDGSRATDVVEAAQRLGYGRLEALVLTHGHTDHAAGVPAALAHVGAVRYWAPLAGPGDVGDAPFAGLARRLGARVETVPSLCRAWDMGGIRVEVLHPCEPEARRFEENDRSLVARLVFGRVAFLLTGDVEGAGEELLLRDPGRLRATVLKLPHHGSSTSASEALLDAVRPAVAVASCGRSTRRPLPHPALVDRLAARGALVLSTGELGAIRFRTDGRAVRAWSARVGELDLPGGPVAPGPG